MPCVVVSLNCNRPRTDFQYSGEQWLAWTNAERINFVLGYTQGFEQGMYKACEAVKQMTLSDALKDKTGASQSQEFPYERCHRAVGDYSNYKIDPSSGLDFSTYVSTITEFYSKYPEYRKIPYLYLIQFMTDKEHKNATDLYAMAKAEKLRTNWGP